ncbi:MAG: hypothetical protein M1514_03545, partial [Patescibacteria group bacterium]|nr:hypothetical protein [Patescibacteria group bacterium]
MIIFKALFIISLYLFPGVFFLKNFNLKKIGLAVLISFVLNSLLWFWLLWLFKLNPQLLITAGLAFNLFFFFIAKKINFELYGESGSNVYKITFGLIAFLILFITAFLYYPLIKPVWIDGYQFFRFPGVFDAFKHLFVVTAIKETGVPPFHPYFPQATLSYYYGWYILPAVASLITNLDFKFAFYIHFLITVLLYLFLTSFLIKKTISENLGRVIALIFATVGFGWDIVPTLIYWGQRQGIIHIEIWISHLKTLLQITSFPTAIIWVPQHLLAVMISLLVVNLLMKAKDVKIYLLAAVLSAYVVFSSIFVAISLFVFIIFTFVKKILEHQEKFTRIFVQYLFMGGGVFLILFPYILSLLSQRGNILKFQ